MSHECVQRFEDESGTDILCKECLSKLTFKHVFEIDEGFYHCFDNFKNVKSPYTGMKESKIVGEIDYCLIVPKASLDPVMYCVRTTAYKQRGYRHMPRRGAIFGDPERSMSISNKMKGIIYD